jgi:hypothetical protein
MSSLSSGQASLVFGWGRGMPGILAARQALNQAVVAGIRQTANKAAVQAWIVQYELAIARGAGGAVATERVAYLRDILRLWD